MEVKSAAGGLPASISSTLSALANLPRGGLVILGLDERTGFRPVPLAVGQSATGRSDQRAGEAGCAMVVVRAELCPLRV